MKVIIADTGAIISLIHIGKLDLLETTLGEFYIAKAVWIELNNYEHPNFDKIVLTNIKHRVRTITSKNYLTTIMDFGESESAILYEQLKADYLLIDDNKARLIAESLDINCIGTLGVLLKAKQMGLVIELKPVFEKLIREGRHFSRRLLNSILIKVGESKITSKKTI